MEDLIGFFQSSLAIDFGYDDEKVIESLQEAMETLRRSRLDLPLPPADPMTERPTRPFGQFDQPSVEQLISCMMTPVGSSLSLSLSLTFSHFLFLYYITMCPTVN